MFKFPDTNSDPADKGQGRPLTITAAVVWFAASLFGTLALLGLTQMIHPDAAPDLVNAVICQALAYLLVVWAAVRVHAPHKPLSDVLAFRHTHPGFYLLAVLLGLSMQVPAELLQRWLLSRWPDSADFIASQQQLLRMDTLLLRVMVPLAAAVLGPIVEEVFFRGALTWGLRRRYGDVAAAVVVGALFAGAHTSFKMFVIYFLLGLVLTYVRMASGSIWPAVLAHVSFNGIAIVGLAAGWVTFGPSTEPMPRVLSTGGVVLTFGVLGSVWLLARRSVVAAQAQSKDFE